MSPLNKRKFHAGLALHTTIPPPKTISSSARKMKTLNVGPQKCRAHVAINFLCRSVHPRWPLGCSLFSPGILSLLLSFALGSDCRPCCFRSVPSLHRFPSLFFLESDCLASLPRREGKRIGRKIDR